MSCLFLPSVLPSFTSYNLTFCYQNIASEGGGGMVTLFCCIFLFRLHCPSDPAQVFCASPASLSSLQWLFPCVCSVTPPLVATMRIPYSAVLGSRRAELQSDTKPLWMECTELPGFGNHVLHQAGKRFDLCVFN